MLCKRLHFPKIISLDREEEEDMFLVAAVALFAIFFINVALGSMGMTVFLGDVGEMVLLFATSIAFVVAVLRREAREADQE